MSTIVQPYLLSVEAYHRMREFGILSEDDRVELIHGQIITMSPKGSRHSNVVNRLTKQLMLGLAGKAEVHSQNPIRLDDLSEPEPDLALLNPPLDQYDDRLPTPADVRLVIEVADSSLLQDQQSKALLYAQAGIAEYWVVNLRADEVEVCQQPHDTGYKLRRRYGLEEEVPVADLGLSLPVSDILGTSG